MHRLIAAILCIAAMFGAQQTITMPFGQAAEIHADMPFLKSRKIQKKPIVVKRDFEPSFTSRAFLVADQH